MTTRGPTVLHSKKNGNGYLPLSLVMFLYIIPISMELGEGRDAFFALGVLFGYLSDQIHILLPYTCSQDPEVSFLK